MKITTEEQFQLDEMSVKINDGRYWDDEANHEHDELIGLFQDIIGETAKSGKGTIIYEYAALLEEQHRLFSPEDIFLFAKENCHLTAADALLEYLRLVGVRINETGLEERQQAKFDEISALLGGVKDLISEFTEAYRRVFGGVANKIEPYIALGFKARMKEAVIANEKTPRKDEKQQKIYDFRR